MLHSGWFDWRVSRSTVLRPHEDGKRPCSQDGASHGLNEPELGVILDDALELADSGFAMLAVVDTFSLAGENDVEVHSENTSLRVVLNSEIDMLVNAKPEVTYVIIKLKS